MATPPPGPGRGRRRHRRGGRARRRRHAERGGQRPGRHATPRSACCPAGRPTCSPAPSAWPTTRSRPTGQLLGALERELVPAHRARLGERPLLPLPRRHGLRRRGGRSRSSARGALKRYAGHPLFVYAALRHLAAPLRPQPARASRCTHADGALVDDGYFCLCLNTNPYTYLGNRPLNVAPDADLDAGLVDGDVPHPRASCRLARRSSASALGTGSWLRRAPQDRLPHRPRRRSPSRATARSRTRSTATTWARPSTSSSATSPTRSIASCQP